MLKAPDSPAFAQWFSESIITNDESTLGQGGTPKVMYHASYRDVQWFDREKSTEWRARSMDTVGIWLSDNPSEDGGAGMYTAPNAGALYPVYVSARRPKVYDRFEDFLREMHEAEGRDIPSSAPGLGSAEGLRHKLKAQGYDSIAFSRSNTAELMEEVEYLQSAVKDTLDEQREAPRTEWPIYDGKRTRLKERIDFLQAEMKAGSGSSTEFDKQYVVIAFEPEQVKSAISAITYDPQSRYLSDRSPEEVQAEISAYCSSVRSEAALGRAQGILDSGVVITADEALQIVQGNTEKPSGVDPQLMVPGAKPGTALVRGPVRLDQIVMNAEGERYDGTVDLERARSYASRSTVFPPVILLQTRDGRVVVSDGGHRVTAARLRGDSHIDAVTRVRLPAPAQTLEVSAPAEASVIPARSQDWSNSQVVDREGQLLRVFHGTTAVVDRFDISVCGSDGVLYGIPAIFATDDPVLASDYAVNKLDRLISDAMREMQRCKYENPGVYDERYEQTYAAVRAAFKQVSAEQRPETGGGANVLPLYMNLQNPMKLDAKGARFMAVMPQALIEAVRLDHDGLIIDNVIDHPSPATEYPARVFIALRPEQVKSAICAVSLSSDNAYLSDRSDAEVDADIAQYLQAARERRAFSLQEYATNNFATLAAALDYFSHELASVRSCSVSDAAQWLNETVTEREHSIEDLFGELESALGAGWKPAQERAVEHLPPEPVLRDTAPALELAQAHPNECAAEVDTYGPEI